MNNILYFSFYVQISLYAIIYIIAKIIYLFIRKDRLGSNAQERSKKRKIILLVQKVLVMVFTTFCIYSSLTFIINKESTYKFLMVLVLQMIMLLVALNEKATLMKIYTKALGVCYVITSILGIYLEKLGTSKYETFVVMQLLYPMALGKKVSYVYTLIIGILLIINSKFIFDRIKTKIMNKNK